MEAYQYFSNPKPTDMCFKISSALFGSARLDLLVGLVDESPFGVSVGRLGPARMVEMLGESES